MSSKLILYYLSGSMPSRACYLLMKTLNLDFEIKEVFIPKKEHFSEDFAKLNPLKKIPVLVDGDYVLYESRAILAYLINSRRPGDSLYPIDPKERGKVDQRLYYDASVFLPNMLSVIVPVIVHDKNEVSQNLKKPIEESLTVLDNYLKENEFIATNNLTIADFSIVPSVTTAKEFGFDLSKYPKLSAWHDKLEKLLPGFEENVHGSKVNAASMKKRLGGAIFQF
ncbi:hypothetical protein ACKWTF_000203 [Chironomus riparius]